MNRQFRWIVSQIGARQHYGVPRGFLYKSQLRLLYTDAWCRWGARMLMRHGPRAYGRSGNAGTRTYPRAKWFPSPDRHSCQGTWSFPKPAAPRRCSTSTAPKANGLPSESPDIYPGRSSIQISITSSASTAPASKLCKCLRARAFSPSSTRSIPAVPKKRLSTTNQRSGRDGNKCLAAFLTHISSD